MEMGMTIDQLEQAVLKLPAPDRARLAERIIASLDQDAEIEREWFSEVKGRDAELDAGSVAAIPLEDALTTVRERFGW
jgi:putative addiction module component (TIGR02574 family)